MFPVLNQIQQQRQNGETPLLNYLQQHQPVRNAIRSALETSGEPSPMEPMPPVTDPNCGCRPPANLLPPCEIPEPEPCNMPVTSFQDALLAFLFAALGERREEMMGQMEFIEGLESSNGMDDSTLAPSAGVPSVSGDALPSEDVEMIKLKDMSDGYSQLQETVNGVSNTYDDLIDSINQNI